VNIWDEKRADDQICDPCITLVITLVIKLGNFYNDVSRREIDDMYMHFTLIPRQRNFTDLNQRLHMPSPSILRSFDPHIAKLAPEAYAAPASHSETFHFGAFIRVNGLDAAYLPIQDMQMSTSWMRRD
jgi:hypothetical protein